MTGVMLLDVGNTRLKLGVLSAGRVCERRLRCEATKELSTVNKLTAWLADSCRAFGLTSNELEACAVCSVIPSMQPVIEQAWHNLSGNDLLFIPEDLPVPMLNRYKDPAQLGPDRLLGVYAAYKIFPNEFVIVVSYGTATTFDCTRGNEYLGGLIGPGLASSSRALARDTARLPEPLLPGALPAIPALSTMEALRAGFIYGFAAMTEGLINRLQNSFGISAKIVLTGGAADCLKPALDIFECHVKPNLQLDGLAAAYLAGRPKQGEQ